MSNINLLPWREELQRRRNSSFYMSAGIAFVIAALIGAVAWWYADQLVQQEQSRIDRLNQEIVKLDAKLETINGLKAEIDSMKQRMDTITRLQESRNQAVHLLNDLPTFVGSGVYLDKVSLNNGKVAVAGATEAHLRVVAMIRAIEASTWLKNPVIKDIVADAGRGNSVVSAAAKQFGLNLSDFNMSFDVPYTQEQEQSKTTRRGRR
jgi:type IV pilus assembly protein PilN